MIKTLPLWMGKTDRHLVIEVKHTMYRLLGGNTCCGGKGRRMGRLVYV